ncbi:unnamed protein product [Ambrosiozyma monospora]|uniref:Unnamed protein product n=1 Tax=Ambrosiozyma monospora TaxID=43982 RepID=A0A9W6YRJ9_AMBMO|nr:unnamed protein product [Ambrosiozyma monospora]
MSGYASLASSPAGSSSKRVNNLYQTSFFKSLLTLINENKTTAITFLLLFFTGDFLIHGPNSIVGGKLHDLSTSSYLTTTQFTNFTTFVRASNHYYPVSVPSKNVKKMSSIEDRLLHYFPFDEYAEGEKNFLKLNNDNEEIPQHFFDQWKKFRNDDKLKLTLIEKNQHELLAMAKEKLKPTVPEVMEALEALPVELQYEFGKYLLAYFNGGLYANENSIVLRPFRDCLQTNVSTPRDIIHF